MAQYIRKPGDKAYRRVNITAFGTPKFTEFTAAAEPVSYPDTAVVLEVLREDGTSELHYERAPGPVSYKAIGKDKFCISRGVPTERLWLCRSDGTGIPYKVPSQLSEENGLAVFHVPCGTNGMELFGDQYFAKVYEGLSVINV